MMLRRQLQTRRAPHSDLTLPPACATCFGHPALRTIGAATATSNLFGTIAGTVEMLFAYNVLGLSVALIGFAATLGSAGGLISAVFADRISKRLGVGRTIVLTIPLGGPMLAVLAFCQPGNDLL